MVDGECSQREMPDQVGHDGSGKGRELRARAGQDLVLLLTGRARAGRGEAGESASFFYLCRI